MEGRCGRCGRVYEISDDFVAMGGRAKCPHCLVELDFDKSAETSPAPADDHFWEATKPDPRRPQPRAPAPPASVPDEIDARCGACQRQYKVDRKYLQAGGEALCPHCNVELELLQEVELPGPAAEPAAAGEELDWQEEPDGQEDLEEMESLLERQVARDAPEDSSGWPDGQEPGPAAEPEPGEEKTTDLWPSASRIDLPELEQLREQTGEQPAGEGADSDPWQAPDESQLEQQEDTQAWQPAGEGLADDELAARQETDVWQAPPEPGEEPVPEEGLDGELSSEETVTAADLGKEQLPDAAGGGFAEEVFGPGREDEPAEDERQWDVQVGETGPAAREPEEESPDEPVADLQQPWQERQADLYLDLEDDADARPGLEDAGADDGEAPAEDLSSAGEAGAAGELEGEQPPGPSAEMMSLFDDVSMEGAAAEPLDDAQMDPGERQPESFAAEEAPAPAGEESSEADVDQWPQEDAGEQDLGEDEPAGDGSAGAEAAQLDLSEDSGSLPEEASEDDWAAAAARWAESGFNPENMPDFIAPGTGDAEQQSPGEAEPEEAEQPAAQGAPAVVADTATVEVSDADILMVDDSEVEPIEDEPSRPQPAAGKDDHWARRASREVAARRQESKVAGRTARKTALARSLSNPFVAGGLGLGVIVLVVVVWWLLAGSEDVAAAAFPLGRCSQAHLVEGPAPSAYKGRRSAVEHYALGNRLAYQGKFEEAVLEYKQATRLDPGFPHPHRALGAIYAALGSKGLSAIEYETYLRLAPDTGDAEQVRRIIAASRQ